MRKIIIKWLLLALVVMSCGAVALAAETAVEDSGAQNAILVIDNSVNAADPLDLRYDAARLAYENILARREDEGSPAGALGVVLFCGSKNCVSCGPVPLNADRATLDGAIGDFLNANGDGRDAARDIGKALREAYAMLRGFDTPEDTLVILLTGGGNDLTGQSGAVPSPGNSAADQRALDMAGKIHEEGAFFRVLALTAPDAADDDFVNFIHALASAGGGAPDPEGSYDNEDFVAADALNNQVLQMLAEAESGPESAQTIADHTPLEGKFTVPYADVSSVAVNITFTPGDRARLGEIALLSPGGQSFEVWNGGATGAEGIGVAEGSGYILLDVPSPEAGEWTVIVRSRDEGDDVPVNVWPLLNHNMRLNLNMRSVFDAGEAVLAEAWFQKYNGVEYEDLADDGIYEATEATLLLYAPGSDPSGEPTQSIPMAYDGEGHYRASYDPEGLGIWTAKVRVQNDYLTTELKYNAFEVTNAPTPTPVPTPTPRPEVAKLRAFDLTIDGLLTDARGRCFINGATESFSAAWTVDGETDSIEAALLEDGKPVLTGLQSGDAIPTSTVRENHSYTLRVTAMPKNGSLVGARPEVREIDFRLAPALGEIQSIVIDAQPLVENGEALCVPRDAEAVTVSWTIEGDMDSVEAALLEDGNVIREDLNSGDAVPREILKDDAAYTVRVSAVPENGALVGAEPVVEELSFSLYPQAQPIEGLTLELPGGEFKKDAWRFEGNQAQLIWRYNAGEAERYTVKITDSKGGPVDATALPGDAKTHTVVFQKNDNYTVELTATPRYALDNSMNATATLVIRPHIKNFFEKYWYFLAGGLAVLLIILAVVLLLLRRNRGGGKAKGGKAGGGKAKVDKKATYIVGTLHVFCEELGLDAELKFDKPKKGGDDAAAAVKEGEPITAHPELAKLKGEDAHRLLNGVKLSMARADSSGKVAGEKQTTGHQPNATVIGLTALLPTGAKETVYVGEYDIGDVTIRRRSPDGDYDFVFWGAARPKKPAAPAPEEPPVEPEAAPPAEPEPAEPEKTIDFNSLADQVLAGATRDTGDAEPGNAQAEKTPDNDATQEEKTFDTDAPQDEKTFDFDTPQDEKSFDFDAPQDEKTFDFDTPQDEKSFDFDAAQDEKSFDIDAAQEEKSFDDDAAQEEKSIDDDAPGGLASAYADLLEGFADGDEMRPDGPPMDLASAYADALDGFTDTEETQSDDQPGGLASAYADVLNGFSDNDETQTDDQPGGLASAYADVLNGFSDNDETQTDDQTGGLASAYADVLNGFSDNDETQTDDQPGGLASAYADVLNGFSDNDETQTDDQPGGLASAYADVLNGFTDTEETQSDDQPGGLASAYADVLNGFSDADEKPSDDQPSGLASAYADFLSGFDDDKTEPADPQPNDHASAYTDFLNRHWDEDKPEE